jgi:hypothetical protein
VRARVCLSPPPRARSCYNAGLDEAAQAQAGSGGEGDEDEEEDDDEDEEEDDDEDEDEDEDTSEEDSEDEDEDEDSEDEDGISSERIKPLSKAEQAEGIARAFAGAERQKAAARRGSTADTAAALEPEPEPEPEPRRRGGDEEAELEMDGAERRARATAQLLHDDARSRLDIRAAVCGWLEQPDT